MCSSDYDSMSAADFGRRLTGLGINLLARDVPSLAGFLGEVFGMTAHRVSADFAIMVYACAQRAHIFQLHADGTYHSNSLPSLLPEAGPRGGGIELRLYETDPDDAEARAIAMAEARRHPATILHPCENKPHGLRECIILCENGYAWIPSRRLTEAEVAAFS